MQNVHDGIRHLESISMKKAIAVIVHDGIRHLEILKFINLFDH